MSYDIEKTSFTFRFFNGIMEKNRNGIADLYQRKSKFISLCRFYKFQIRKIIYLFIIKLLFDIYLYTYIEQFVSQLCRPMCGQRFYYYVHYFINALIVNVSNHTPASLRLFIDLLNILNIASEIYNFFVPVNVWSDIVNFLIKLFFQVFCLADYYRVIGDGYKMFVKIMIMGYITYIIVYT